jgi:hypothetical protein
MAIDKIAILRSTKPLRMLKSKRGRVYESIDPKALGKLTDHFDLIIIGSTASDELYKRIYSQLTGKGKDKFRMYSKSYFSEFGGAGLFGRKKDEKNEGWKEIFKTNRIKYELTRRVFGQDFRYHFEDFDWKEMEHFVTDERVTFVDNASHIPGMERSPEVNMPPGGRIGL